MSNSKPENRIAFYTSGECYGGLEKNALHFIQWLKNEAYDISLITDTESEIAIAGRTRNIPVHILTYPENYFSIKKTRWLKRVILRENISMLFIIRPRDILTTVFLKAFLYRKLRLVLFQQSVIRLEKSPFVYTLLFRPFDAWISPSKAIQDRMLKKTRYNPARMLMIPPCIDTEHFNEERLSKKEIRRSLNLPEEKIIVGTLGQHDTKRKHDFLIRAVQLLKRNNYHIDLLIMGRSTDEIEEEYFEFLNELCRECAVVEQVHFRPYPEKITDFFSAVDIFVMNWDPEPYDLFIPKAMASGVNVIARYSESNAELLDEGRYGLLYKPGDLQDLSAKIIHLITQPMLSDHLKEVAKERVTQYMDRKIACERVQELIKKLLEI